MASDLIRLVTAGSVDDGKSTLIGRLLYDTKSVLSDQLDAVRTSTEQGPTDLDLSPSTSLSPRPDLFHAARPRRWTGVDSTYKRTGRAERSLGSKRGSRPAGR